MQSSDNVSMQSNLFRITSKITALSKSGLITNARKLFDEMPKRDTVAWNSMITGYSHLGFLQEALSLLNQMRNSNNKPDDFTFTATLSACANGSSLLNGTKIHALVIVLGYQCSLPVCNSLIDMYGKCFNAFSAGQVFKEMSSLNEVTWCSLLFAYSNCGQFNEAREVFELVPNKTEIAWNTVIAGLGRYGELELCLDAFKEMRWSLCEPDQWTYSSLISSCTESLAFVCGCMLHGVIIKSGWSCAVEANNSILSFYAKLGSLNDAIKVIDNAGMLSLVSSNAIIDAYMKAGNVHEAFLRFQSLQEKNVVSWTSMITGYARNGYGEDALRFFVSMAKNCLLPDDFTFGAVLHACSSLAVLGHGRMVHGFATRHGFSAYVYVGNGLVNMYARCGDLNGSILAFHDIFEKDLVSFNAMVFTYGLHGKASEALQLYKNMIAAEMKPDKMTFIGLLMACSHSGLIEEGRVLFKSINSVHGLPYDADHIACMVDMLGRSGYLAEAKELADKCSKIGDAKATSCEALLGACSTHTEVEMGTLLGGALKKLDPCKEISYVLRSNLYSARGQWKEAETVRKQMIDEGLKKLPGCSWIEVGCFMTSFVAGDNSHLRMDKIYKMLHFLEFQMKNP